MAKKSKQFYTGHHKQGVLYVLKEKNNCHNKTLSITSLWLLHSSSPYLTSEFVYSGHNCEHCRVPDCQDQGEGLLRDPPASTNTRRRLRPHPRRHRNYIQVGKTFEILSANSIRCLNLLFPNFNTKIYMHAKTFTLIVFNGTND